MTDPSKAGSGGRLAPIAGVAALGALVIAGAIAFVGLSGDPSEEAPGGTEAPAVQSPPEAPGVTAAPDIAGPDAALTQSAPAAPAVADAPPPPLAPEIDLVRVDAAGNAVIAGRAAALAEVTLAIDGDPVETVAADAGGQFVAMLALAPSDAPRILSLQAVSQDGTALAGLQTAIIAPFAGEALAAALPPEPAPAVRADRPGVGEVTGTPPVVADGIDGDLSAAPATTLPETGTEARPAAETAPPEGPPAAAAPTALAQDPTAPPADPEAETVAETVPQTPAIAPQGPAVLLADRDGVRLVQAPGAPPEALSELRLDAITYDLAGDVTLAGRGPADASVRVTLNNQPINLGEIGPGGQWSLDLPDVDPGTYTLRLEQVAADGTVTRGIETPFLREDPARIRDNPMLVEDGAAVITVQRGFTLWGIAEANFGNGILYVQIFEENRAAIRDPDLIFPGQIFALPDLPRQNAGHADR